MNGKNYTVTFTVDKSPEEALKAITNIRGWWSENITGETDKLGATFKYAYQDVHRCTLKMTEFVPGKKVVWHVVDNFFSFTNDKTEWKGTDLVFEISEKDGKTEVTFTHVGLVPSYECYDLCSDAWGTYIKSSLKDLITKGKGNPNVGEAITEDEKRLGK